jgi:hypothetical protein
VFGVVLTFGCLHDMPHPDRAARAIKRCLVTEGTWLIKEIRAGETWQENLARPPPSRLLGWRRNDRQAPGRTKVSLFGSFCP